MFRLHKSNKQAKSGERIDFKFSQFKLLQVPKGWDKLHVSIISVETGKTIAKSSKGIVKNGNCQWNDTVSESIWISSQDGQISKELEDFPYKLLVATGSSRSGILGEALVNMATYINSSDSVLVSFPLKKSNNGTVLQSDLQLKIQCLTPRKTLREGESETISNKEELNSDSKNVEIKSEVSDDSITKSVRSYSSRDLGYIPLQEDQRAKDGGEAVHESSFSTSDSYHSYNSSEISVERDEHNLISVQDSAISEASVFPRSSNVDNASQSENSSCKSQITHSDNLSQDGSQEFAASSLKISDSSRSLLEAAEDTIEELCSEAKKWERNARKNMIDLELLRKEYSEQSKNQLNLSIELSEAQTERVGLQKEVEQLKLLLEKSMERPAASEISEFKYRGVGNVVKELENEIKFLKESNSNLVLQLNRSQDSNAELVTVLQEFEETVGKQKEEIESLDVAAEKNEELLLQIQQLQESEKYFQDKVQELEKELENKTQDLEIASSDHRSVLDMEIKLSARENEILSLKEKLSETEKLRQCLAEKESVERNLMEEIEPLKAKLIELESDCQELTDENLELLIKIKEMKNSSVEGNACSKCDNRSQIEEFDHNDSIQELENLRDLERKVAELSEDLCDKREMIAKLEGGLQSKEEQIMNLQRNQIELEDRIYAVLKENSQLEEQIEIVTRESEKASNCINELRNELTILSNNVHTHVSANKDLETKTFEIENGKREMEIRISELKQENEELSACTSVMEAQIRNLTDDRQSVELELENFKSNAVPLNDEIARLKNEMEAERRDLKQKLVEMQNQLSEAEEELEHLRSANPKLQATAESLMEERSLLQKSNEELKTRNVELEGQRSHLETKLKESQRSFSDCSKRVLVLQESICSLLDQSAAKERSLSSELDTLLKENEKQNKKHNLVHQMYAEKMVQVEKLQQEIEDLKNRLATAKNENDRIESDMSNQVSDLRANVAKLESELNAIRTESKMKIESLTDELASSKENQEMLKADNKKMLKLLENYRSCEENFKTTLNGLELKLTVSEYERQQLIEECGNLKSQLLKIESLEDELNTIKSAKLKLEASLNSKSEEFKDLTSENNLCIDKITELQKIVSELEDCREDKIFLEEKLQKMEKDLAAKQALCKQEAELKNELNRIKRTNKQLQQHNQQLEEEKQKCRTRIQSLEEELVMINEKQRSLRESKSMNSPNNQHQRELLDDEVSKSTEANAAYKAHVTRLASDGRKGWTGSPKKPKAESEFVSKEKFERTKSSLEAELKDLRERYFEMSLKYAEVEGERGELIMKLKTANSAKRWF